MTSMPALARTWTLVATLLALLALNGCSGLWLEGPAPTNLKGRIAYSAPGAHGLRQIFTMNADRSGRMAVTTDDAPHIEPAWSPDGKRLVYVQNEVGLPTMWVINADGSGRTQLSGLPGYVDTPSWSPDGTKIVFAAHLDGEDYQIYVVDSAGNKWQRITHTNTSDGYPAWSPDGKKIVFSSSPKGAVSEDIYVMDTDGSNRVRLTNGPGKSFSPSWSPDGQHIAFTYEGGIASGWEIWKMKPDGTGRTRLTRATSAASLWLDTNPHWSPDSEYIVFEGARDSVDNDIYVVKADGTELYQLATNAVGPAWAPK